jgi:site-specific DNA-methyltransferase (adenine-specific)
MVASYEIDQTDVIDFLRTFEDESVDLICTDPAYESLEKHRSVGTTTRLTNAWFPIFPNERFEELFEECYRVLAKQRHMYIMCDQETMFHIKPIGEAAGFKFWKPIVWDKLAMGTGYHYRARTEFILFFEKRTARGGKGKGLQLNSKSICDILQIKRLKKPKGVLYPTEKPVDLIKILIEQSTQPGQCVVDPFMGSGAVGEASLVLGRDFFGCDIEDDAITRATARLQNIEG